MTREKTFVVLSGMGFIIGLGMGVVMYLLREELALVLHWPRRYPRRLEVRQTELDRMDWEGGVTHPQTRGLPMG